MINRLKELFPYRELLYVLTVREVQIRYKQSVLGIAWAIIQPLGLMLIFSVLLKVPSDDIPYPIFSKRGTSRKRESDILMALVQRSPRLGKEEVV